MSDWEDPNENLAYPPRHDKTAYELQLENNRLKTTIQEIENIVISSRFVTREDGKHFSREISLDDSDKILGLCYGVKK